MMFLTCVKLADVKYINVKSPDDVLLSDVTSPDDWILSNMTLPNQIM